MHRRSFLKQSGAGLAVSRLLHAQSASSRFDLKRCTVTLPSNATARMKKAATVLVEEVEKRTQISWLIAEETALGGVVVSLAIASGQPHETYSIRADRDRIAITGSDERGLLFGVGKLLRAMICERQSVTIDTRRVAGSSAPKYALRGHQLGYRPKTNAYDAWNVAMWDQYIRDLAMFGTNAIELIPPRSDDLADSPHFPVPPEQMMVEMSRICDSYDLDVWVWYPAMDPDYADPATVESALKEWAHIYELVPRIDAVFVPGGDPGHTAPKPMFAFLEKQKANLRRFHPKAQIWMSPQGFREEWMKEFFSLVEQPGTSAWLDGIVYGPQSRFSLAEFRERIPKRYPIRFYPDITHSIGCQFPVPDWDVAYALTEGRETINPRPEGEANILRRFCPYTIGFLTYSEGCNDDVNKFVWSALGWDPEMHVIDALREFAQYFFGAQYADSVAQGLLNLERNWNGALATNERVKVTLAQFQQLERKASPAVLENWRFQQALYRAYFDDYLRSRLLEETACVERAWSILSTVNEIGWNPEPLEIGGAPSKNPPNGRDPALLLEEADHALAEAATFYEGIPSRTRVKELGEALLQSIHMQLAVDRYQGEAVVRGANLETLDYPVSNMPWLRTQLSTIRKLGSANEQVTAIKQLAGRIDPGPGGFYDDLGDPENRLHLIPGPGPIVDPEFRKSVLTGFSYPDRLGNDGPIEWKRWAESLYDAALQMRYDNLDPEASYKIRVVYSGDARRVQIRLAANVGVEIHSFMTRPWPPKPLEFDIPVEATRGGQLELAWTREQGLGGNGRGCQVSEVWLIRK
jgi:hypothetical protein